MWRVECGVVGECEMQNPMKEYSSLRTNRRLLLCYPISFFRKSRYIMGASANVSRL